MAFKYFNGWRLVILLLLLFVFGNMFIYLAEKFLSDFYLFDRLTRNEDVSGAVENESRLQLYGIAWKYFLEHPLLGVGLNQFRLYSEGKIHIQIYWISWCNWAFLPEYYTLFIYVKLFNKIIKLKKLFLILREMFRYTRFLLCFASEVFFGTQQS